MGEIWQYLLDSIFYVLKYFYSWVGDWGLAIILLTIVFRIVLIPLTWKQTKSMYELQEIQPKIKALQEKYKNDKEKQQEEMMKFYQENKVNPFGGCLPLLLQMPLFIALFNVLQQTLPKYISTLPVAQQATEKQFWLLLPDITMSPQQVYSIVSSTPTTAVDAAAGLVATSTVVPQGGVFAGVIAVLPYIVLVVLFGLSVWLPQYLMTQDPTQRKTGTYMAIVMLWFGFVSPAGVLLYWVTSSGWQVGQQILTQRVLKGRKAAQEAETALQKAEEAAEKAAKRAQKSAESGPSKATGKGKKK